MEKDSGIRYPVRSLTRYPTLSAGNLVLSAPLRRTKNMLATIGRTRWTKGGVPLRRNAAGKYRSLFSTPAGSPVCFIRGVLVRWGHAALERSLVSRELGLEVLKEGSKGVGAEACAFVWSICRGSPSPCFVNGMRRVRVGKGRGGHNPDRAMKKPTKQLPQGTQRGGERQGGD